MSGKPGKRVSPRRNDDTGKQRMHGYSQISFWHCQQRTHNYDPLTSWTGHARIEVVVVSWRHQSIDKRRVPLTFVSGICSTAVSTSCMSQMLQEGLSSRRNHYQFIDCSYYASLPGIPPGGRVQEPVRDYRGGDGWWNLPMGRASARISAFMPVERCSEFPLERPQVWSLMNEPGSWTGTVNPEVFETIVVVVFVGMLPHTPSKLRCYSSSPEVINIIVLCYLKKMVARYSKLPLHITVVVLACEEHLPRTFRMIP